MDVDANSYPHRLLGILIAISEADFVSFDLELTGIPSRLPGKEPWQPRPANRDRTTLEDRYQETREAAGRYQILQVGLTCARFDYVTKKYVLRPYNIPISPLLNEEFKLDIEREIHIQSGAATFLLKHGFDLGAPFAHGVQYLSRAEARWAQQRVNERLEKKSEVADMQLKESDVQSLDFVRRVREAIIAWKTSNDMDMLEITTHTGFAEQSLDQVITRFEKRLVHQLVRAEFPELVTVGRNECIRIIYYNEQREEDNKHRIKRRVKEHIAKQTGFRWIFDALAADGDLHEADPYYFGRYTSAYIIAEGATDTKQRFDRALDRLQKHKPVIVGHNMLTDLVYFYRSFVGELPETLDEFREALHQIFPRIVDTKYLATHAEGDLNASPTLQDIAEKIERQPLPDIVTHADHPKYHDSARFHEAGYDSLLTATILLRLSAKLDIDRQQQHDSDSGGSFKTALENPNDHKKSRAPGSPTTHPQPPRQEFVVVKKPAKNKKKNKASGLASTPKNRFKTRNMFEQLSIDDQGASSPSDENQGGVAVSTAAAASWQDVVDEPDTSGWVPIETRRREPMEMIPAWDSDFWQEFGNTLRVYGTQEAVLKIAKWGS
ncbi:CAF1-domain-containing protein [Bimuria novae-zelandiae CBS 107.79]|uniref:CAF1-domain-containing protein n=1 Tax=Bimuria novae-zelandiae CBS 107.79 TaxID=1447943 RepID=A0A6A5V709_9PLEO|nr:CAF1-domain-containing protein [Bimuria novae-zelandiae CBS 107.79]